MWDTQVRFRPLNPEKSWISGRYASCCRAFLSGELFNRVATEDPMNNSIEKKNERESGRVLVPAILWMAGVPFTLVLLLWLLFFRG